MENFIFQNPVKLIMGHGMIARLSKEIPSDKRIMITFGGGSVKKNGVYDQVKEALKDHFTIEFWGIEPNPAIETLRKAIALGKEQKVDYLLAVGGGSVIDGTKLISAGILYDGDAWDLVLAGRPVTHTVPLSTVLTLPATGSEMNERAVISRESVHEKLNFMSPLVFPKFAILDPQVTYSLPERQVANGVVDSFIHVVEQYLTYPVNAKVQDYFAEGLMKTIVEEGRKVLQNPNDYDIRANLMWAATNALNCWIGQGVPQDWSSHRMGYALTAQFGLDHAQTLAVILPGVMTYMRKEKAAKLIRMGEVVFGITEGSADEKAQKSIEATEDFFHFMGLKTRLSDYGIKESDLDALVEPIDRMGWKLGEYGNINSKVAKEILLLRL